MHFHIFFHSHVFQKNIKQYYLNYSIKRTLSFVKNSNNDLAFVVTTIFHFWKLVFSMSFLTGWERKLFLFEWELRGWRLLMVFKELRPRYCICLNPCLKHVWERKIFLFCMRDQCRGVQKTHWPAKLDPTRPNLMGWVGF